MKRKVKIPLNKNYHTVLEFVIYLKSPSVSIANRRHARKPRVVTHDSLNMNFHLIRSLRSCVYESDVETSRNNSEATTSMHLLTENHDENSISESSFYADESSCTTTVCNKLRRHRKHVTESDSIKQACLMADYFCRLSMKEPRRFCGSDSSQWRGIGNKLCELKNSIWKRDNELTGSSVDFSVLKPPYVNNEPTSVGELSISAFPECTFEHCCSEADNWVDTEFIRNASLIEEEEQKNLPNDQSLMDKNNWSPFINCNHSSNDSTSEKKSKRQILVLSPTFVEGDHNSTSGESEIYLDGSSLSKVSEVEIQDHEKRKLFGPRNNRCSLKEVTKVCTAVVPVSLSSIPLTKPSTCEWKEEKELIPHRYTSVPFHFKIRKVLLMKKGSFSSKRLSNVKKFFQSLCLGDPEKKNILCLIQEDGKDIYHFVDTHWNLKKGVSSRLIWRSSCTGITVEGQPVVPPLNDTSGQNFLQDCTEDKVEEMSRMQFQAVMSELVTAAKNKKSKVSIEKLEETQQLKTQKNLLGLRQSLNNISEHETNETIEENDNKLANIRLEPAENASLKQKKKADASFYEPVADKFMDIKEMNNVKANWEAKMLQAKEEEEQMKKLRYTQQRSYNQNQASFKMSSAALRKAYTLQQDSYKAKVQNPTPIIEKEGTAFNREKEEMSQRALMEQEKEQLRLREEELRKLRGNCTQGDSDDESNKSPFDNIAYFNRLAGKYDQAEEMTPQSRSEKTKRLAKQWEQIIQKSNK